MLKPTKNEITRSQITASLLWDNKASLRSSLFLFFATSVLLLPLAILAIHLMITATAPILLRIGIAIVVTIPCGGPSVYFLVHICLSFAKRRTIREGKYMLQTLPLSDKCEKLVGRHIEQIFKFPGFRDVTVGSTAYQLAEVGDEYYIVHYPGKSTVLCMYAAKTNEIKER